MKKHKGYKMTIAAELFEAWNKSRRKGDPVAIAGILGKSRITIDNALNYGYVQDQEVVKGITEFFKKRLVSERNEGKEMLKEIDS